MKYKGFNIELSALNGRFYFGERVQHCGFLDDDACSKDGYATEAAAKVAISKYLNKQAVQDAKEMDEHIEQSANEQYCIKEKQSLIAKLDVAVELAQTLHKQVVDAAASIPQQTRAKREGRFVAEWMRHS